MQSTNGQLLLQPEPAKPKRHTAKHCPVADQQRIINDLANGDSIRAIARALHRSPNTVTAIARTNVEAIEDCRRRMTGDAAELADRARERALATVDSAPPAVANAIYGTAVDKMIALGGNAASGVPQRLHYHAEATNEAFLDYALFKSKHREYEVDLGYFLDARQIALDLGWTPPANTTRPASRPNGSASEIRSTQRLSLRGRTNLDC